jgi:hypothetical protein
MIHFFLSFSTFLFRWRRNWPEKKKVWTGVSLVSTAEKEGWIPRCDDNSAWAKKMAANIFQKGSLIALCSDWLSFTKCVGEHCRPRRS